MDSMVEYRGVCAKVAVPAAEGGGHSYPVRRQMVPGSVHKVKHAAASTGRTIISRLNRILLYIVFRPPLDCMKHTGAVNSGTSLVFLS